MEKNEKLCVKCGVVKNLNDFLNDKHCKNGKKTSCKTCINKYKREKRLENKITCDKDERQVNIPKKVIIIKKQINNDKIIDQINTKIVVTQNEKKKNNIGKKQRVYKTERQEYKNIYNYEDLEKLFDARGCKLLTTKEDMKIVNDFICKYVNACCKKEAKISLYNFLKNKQTGIKCLSCICKERMNKPNNNIGVSNTVYIEYQGYNYIKELLEKDFNIIKINTYAKADILIKPKNINKDEYIMIQLKTTSKINKNSYNFNINNNDYKNILIIAICNDDKKMWLVEGSTLKSTTRLYIHKNNTTFNSITNENIIEKLLLEYNKYMKIQSNYFDNNNDNKYKIRENEMYKLREKILPNLKYEYPDVEGTVWDLQINGLKIQDKVSKNKSNSSYSFSISKCKNKNKKTLINNKTFNHVNNKNMPYELGDNDFYWLWLYNTDYFYVIPERVLFNNEYIISKNAPINNLLKNLILYDIKENKYDDYKLNKNDKNLESKILQIFKNK
jgi:hypothetical protein